jgi:hypothetical protein
LGCLPEFRRTAARDDPNIEAASADGTTAPDFQPLSNRLVRTRMPGGVGGGRRKPPAYPIMPSWASSPREASPRTRPWLPRGCLFP